MLSNTMAEGALATPLPERAARGVPGWPALGLGLLALLGGVARLVAGGPRADHALGVVLLWVGALMLAGLTAVAPGQARVILVFGRYAGTLRTPGLRWVVPIARRPAVSTRIRNHETATAKVNDADGVPIEIAAVVVWQVVDTALALFAVEDFVDFVTIQTETAVRHIASSYPYDGHRLGELSLRDKTEEIACTLANEIAARTAAAGVRAIEARITRLAYAPEIAQAMLQVQQASAVVAARQRIVEGAVGMVEMALARLAEDDVVELDDERRAAMVSNLLVVLCGERGTQPIVNVGSLYH